jgi:hypothetical protein
MKKVSLIALTLLLTAATAFSQSPCDKKVVYHSDKQEMMNADGEVEKNNSDDVEIEVSKQAISLRVDGNVKFTGTVKEITCEWKKVYEEGKAFYKVTFAKDNGETSEGSITIEAKDGKLTVVFEIAAMNGRKAKALISKYEEK